MTFFCPSGCSCCSAPSNHKRQSSLSVLKNVRTPFISEVYPSNATLLRYAEGPGPENPGPSIVTLAAPLVPVGLPGAGLRQPAADHVADRKVGHVAPRRIRPEALIDDHRGDQHA